MYVTQFVLHLCMFWASVVLGGMNCARLHYSWTYDHCELWKKKECKKTMHVYWKEVCQGFKHKDTSLVPAPPATINTAASDWTSKDLHRYNY